MKHKQCNNEECSAVRTGNNITIYCNPDKCAAFKGTDNKGKKDE